MPTAHPLEWPGGFPRTEARKRKHWPSKLSFGKARDSLFGQLETTGAKNIVVSTNIETYTRGGREIPYAGQATPDDPGVAAYFELEGEQRVLCCDQYRTPEANMRAIAITVRDLRRIAKRGVSDFLKRAYQGFKRLPEHGGGEPWWEILWCEPDASEEEIRRAYRQRAKETHPDRGGTKEDFELVREAFEQALATRM